MSLTMIYTRRYLVEMIRTPVMFLSITMTPVAVMLFFFVPFVGSDAVMMTATAATMMVFAVLLGCVGHFATTVSATRESTWGTYLRTLPGGLAPEVTANLLTGLAMVAAAIVPVVAVAAIVTAATASIGQVLLAAVAVLATVVTFTLMGLALGYLLSFRAALIVASVGALPLAVAGGMFFDPAEVPAVIATIAPYVPTRGATDLVLFALTGRSPDTLALVLLVVWTVVFAALLVWGHRRDEGRRFR